MTSNKSYAIIILITTTKTQLSTVNTWNMACGNPALIIVSTPVKDSLLFASLQLSEICEQKRFLPDNKI